MEDVNQRLYPEANGRANPSRERPTEERAPRAHAAKEAAEESATGLRYGASGRDSADLTAKVPVVGAARRLPAEVAVISAGRSPSRDARHGGADALLHAAKQLIEGA